MGTYITAYMYSLHILIHGGNMKASLTLESSFVYPVTILITCILIIYGFRLHDRLCSKSEAYIELIQLYSSPQQALNTNDFINHINDCCLLSRSPRLKAYTREQIHLSHSTGQIIVNFSNYDRCCFIRRINATLDLIN